MASPDGGAHDDVGPRLADWLDDLGLGDQLAAAGLPAYERDADGAARWTDPATGGPPTAERLAELEEMLHGQGEDPEHAVPVALVQLRRAAQVRADLLTSPWLDYAGLAERQGVSENAARFGAHRAAERGALLLVQHEGRTLVPAFQLDDAGEVRAELRAVLEPMLTSRLDPWLVWSWLTRPAALLGGAVPHEAAHDPAELPLVQSAALRLAERA